MDLGTVLRCCLVLVVACGSSAPAPTAPPPPPQHEHHHHGTQPLGHRFEEAERWVPVFDDPARDAWQQPERVIGALAIAPGMTVADVGAGTGYFEARLAAAVGAQGKVLALDIEPDMVRYLRERATREKTPNVEARQSLPDDPQLAPASVDRILIVDTWHHIPDRVAYTKKLAAALRPGGMVVVVDFTMETSKGPPRQHRIPPDAVKAELEQGGLHASLIDAGLPDQFVMAGTRP